MEEKKWYLAMTYKEAKEIFRENLENMARNFIAAGYCLKYIRDNEMYRQDGYDSIWEFAQDTYQRSKSTACLLYTSRCV